MSITGWSSKEARARARVCVCVCVCFLVCACTRVSGSMNACDWL